MADLDILGFPRFRLHSRRKSWILCQSKAIQGLSLISWKTRRYLPNWLGFDAEEE
jgi:hypothetical protein